MLPVETPRLRLRFLEPRDAVRLADYRSDAFVARYQSWEEMTVEEALEFISGQPPRLLASPDEWGQLAIADRLTDEIIGDNGLCRRGTSDTAEIDSRSHRLRKEVGWRRKRVRP